MANTVLLALAVYEVACTLFVFVFMSASLWYAEWYVPQQQQKAKQRELRFAAAPPALAARPEEGKQQLLPKSSTLGVPTASDGATLAASPEAASTARKSAFAAEMTITKSSTCATGPTPGGSGGSNGSGSTDTTVVSVTALPLVPRYSYLWYFRRLGVATGLVGLIESPDSSCGLGLYSNVAAVNLVIVFQGVLIAWICCFFYGTYQLLFRQMALGLGISGGAAPVSPTAGPRNHGANATAAAGAKRPSGEIPRWLVVLLVGAPFVYIIGCCVCVTIWVVGHNAAVSDLPPGMHDGDPGVHVNSGWTRAFRMGAYGLNSLWGLVIMVVAQVPYRVLRRQFRDFASRSMFDTRHLKTALNRLTGPVWFGFVLAGVMMTYEAYSVYALATDLSVADTSARCDTQGGLDDVGATVALKLVMLLGCWASSPFQAFTRCGCHALADCNFWEPLCCCCQYCDDDMAMRGGGTSAVAPQPTGGGGPDIVVQLAPAPSHAASPRPARPAAPMSVSPAAAASAS